MIVEKLSYKRPINNASRWSILPSFKSKTKFKGLLSGFRRSYGRDSSGHITSRAMSLGHKRLFRNISFKRSVFDNIGKVMNIEYDPNRTALIAFLAAKKSGGAFLLRIDDTDRERSDVKYTNQIKGV